ncbi:hypothetical protein FA13DRAFT_1725621 [Coprinellus micaceus]|uniref:Uncharacterized protein n=1 Tax=Coprinellus micaceus TaxID=71717 RepID=A0A4Y7TWQ0_COPMI|nr:hypothetical protein FA13DRAFT_1725621 [Coprinellus micaceus]
MSPVSKHLAEPISLRRLWLSTTFGLRQPPNPINPALQDLIHLLSGLRRRPVPSVEIDHSDVRGECTCQSPWNQSTQRRVSGIQHTLTLSSFELIPS